MFECDRVCECAQICVDGNDEGQADEDGKKQEVRAVERG